MPTELLLCFCTFFCLVLFFQDKMFWLWSFRSVCICAFDLTHTLFSADGSKQSRREHNKQSEKHTQTYTHTLRGIYRSPKNIHVKCAFSISPICLYSLLSLITPQYCSGNSAHVVRVTLLHHTDNFLQRKFD